MFGRMKLYVTTWYCRFLKVRQRWYFLANARRYRYARPAFGVTVVGALETRGSLGKVLRDLVRHLKASGIPYQTYSTSIRRRVPDRELAGFLTPRRDFRSRRFGCVVEMFDSDFPAEALGLKRATIAFWEFDSGLFEAHAELRGKPLLVGMSDFNAAYYRSIARPDQRASKLLYPFTLPPHDLPSRDVTRDTFGLGRDDFIVFFNFDYGSSLGRKNPEGAVRAFARAFSGRPDAKLVFKTQGAAAHPQAVQTIHGLIRALGLERQFVSIDRYISETDVYALTKACDAYLSLHRGEGFGLGVAEAMSLGKPVVVTDYSATTEFCTSLTAMPVAWRPVPLTEGQRAEHPFLRHVRTWAEPDVDAAARALTRLYEDPALRQRIGNAAKALVEDHFSPARFRASVTRLLEGLDASARAPAPTHVRAAEGVV